MAEKFSVIALFSFITSPSGVSVILSIPTSVFRESTSSSLGNFSVLNPNPHAFINGDIVGSNAPDVATYNLPIYSEDGEKIKFNLWMMDSAWTDKELDRTFSIVKPEALEWYKKKSADLKEANGGEPVPSLMFQHIPMIEEFELTEECSADAKGAVKGPDGKYIKLKDSCKGVLGEYICAVDEKTGQMEAMKECGDIKGIVFGHDHCNCFEGVVDGINFIQTACASFRCYGKRYRGVRIFDIDENGNYETKFYTYKDLMGNGILNELAFIWDADGFLKQKLALIAGGVIGLGAIAAGIINLLK